MGKKNVLAALFLFGVLSFMTSSAGPIKYLTWADTGRPSAPFVPIYSVTPADTTITFNYDSTSPVLTFHVPGVQNTCQRIFFDWKADANTSWTATDPWRFAQISVDAVISSSAIPPGIIVAGFFNICNHKLYLAAPGFGGLDHPQVASTFVMDRSVYADWRVNYAAGGSVPLATALKIINRLMNQGFDVSVFPYGGISGVGKLDYLRISVLVTGN